MYSVTSEPTASVSVQTPPKPARSEPSQAEDGFGALVDSNTTSGPPAPPAEPNRAPRRSERSAPGPEKGARDTSTAGPSSPAKSADTSDATAPAASDAPSGPASTDPTAKPKPEGPGTKSPASKDNAPKPDGSDALASTIQSGDSAQQNAPQVAPDPTAIIAVVTVAPADAGAAGAQPAGDKSPLSIAAAGITASAATAAQIASPAQTQSAAAGGATTDKPAAADKNGATNALISEAGATAKAGSLVADPQAGPTVAAAIDAPMPKATLKALAAIQSKTNPSNLAGTTADPTDADATAATPNAPATGTSTSQAVTPTVPPKPPANGKSVETSADADGPPEPKPVLPAHDHAAAAQVTANQPDPASQAAAALQAPSSTTTTTAGASTATLTVTGPMPSAVPLSGVPLEIAAFARSGKTRFEIRLDPAELGRIDVRIAVDRNGQVTSHLMVEKPETLSMLRQDAPQLQRALDDAGLKTGSNGLSFSLRDQSSSGQNGGNDHSGGARRLTVTEEDALPAPAARSYGRMLGPAGGVDIRV